MFRAKNFCHIASNNRNNVKVGVFVYRTTDDLATVLVSGYFNERIIDINLHDIIIHEKIDATDNTKVEKNVLCVTERTLDNVGTTVIKSKWEGDIEQEIDDLRTYVNNNFVKIDGTSIMTGPLKMRATPNFKCAIAPCWDGVGFFKLNDNNSVSLMASIEYNSGFEPATTNTYNIGVNARKWKNLYLSGVAYLSKINNGYDIAVPVTNSADTLALKSQVDDAANSGEQLYTTGVWYAKMYAATVVPSSAEVEGRNYADFSQVDGQGDPIIVVYTYTSGAWTTTATITPPANHNGYMTITSKIWDISEQAGQQGGKVLWSHNQKTFTPYPMIISFEDAALTGTPTAPTPDASSPNNQVANKEYVDNKAGANTDLSNLTSTGNNIANWSTNVSNCLVEIPQDINLTLDNTGILTLKAGSRCYLKTDTTTPSVTIASDLTTTQTSDGTYFAIYNGSTLTTVTTNVYTYSTLPNTYSLPLALITVSSGKISNIDQIFNGFGYIASTIFALPGVKGLVPYGRNADGTLKSTVYVVPNIIKRDYAGSTVMENVPLFLESTETFTTGNRLKYDEKTNLLINTNFGTAELNKFAIGICSFNTVFTKLNTRPVFHAVDMSDADYVIESQLPTANNNYTWYRKYKSGWIEQGGLVSDASGDGSVVLPITMADTNYDILAINEPTDNENAWGWVFVKRNTKTTTGFGLSSRYGSGVEVYLRARWQVSGMAA